MLWEGLYVPLLRMRLPSSYARSLSVSISKSTSITAASASLHRLFYFQIRFRAHGDLHWTSSCEPPVSERLLIQKPHRRWPSASSPFSAPSYGLQDDGILSNCGRHLPNYSFPILWRSKLLQIQYSLRPTCTLSPGGFDTSITTWRCL